METINWEITTGCDSLGGACESCPSLLEYRDKGWDYTIKTHEKVLQLPYDTAEPTIFTVSLGSDLFHDKVPDEFIKRAFDVMNGTPRHVYEITTKRVERMALLGGVLRWTPNILAGTVVESDKEKWRIDFLRNLPTENLCVTFILGGDVGKVDLSRIKVVAVLEEQWGLKRPCEPEWIENILRQCHEQGVQVTSNYNMYAGKE